MPDSMGEPSSLGEAVTRGMGQVCPIPATHDRMDECHYWWHQMAKNYHEPPYFRWSLGAFLQAARNVTWMLQAEKHVFEDFDSWYLPWQEGARSEPLLRWLNETRVMLTKRAALAPRSWARFRCLFEQVDPDYDPDDEDDLYLNLNPFACTHYYIRAMPAENHGHEYLRQWEVDDLPGRELLAACADIYDLLGEIVALAHRQLRHEYLTVHEAGDDIAEPRPHRMPCMIDTDDYRTVRTRVVHDEEIWEDSPEHV